MSESNPLSDLIARLEATTEGSRELDARIKIALDDPQVLTNSGDHRGRGVEWTPASQVFTDTWQDWDAAAAQCDALHYTTSIDYALLLLPEGMWWAVGAGRTRPDEPLYGAAIYRPIVSEDPDIIEHGENEKSPALALCIAALKARMSLTHK